jgi:outer membrane receptor protein involved in Fe transport|nr:MAG: TonB-dependent receptor [Pseudomonadota bacterium]
MPIRPRLRATAVRAATLTCARPAVALCLAVAAGLPAPAQAQGVPDLTELSLEQLLDLKIVGASKYAQSQGEVAAAASVITRQDIRAFGWRTLDEALASLPGIHITESHQISALGARGFGLPGDFNTRVLVMINGHRVNEPIYDSGVGGQGFPLDLDLVERIEFIPGPGGAVYGQNAMFGVVNVITRTAADLDGTEIAVAYQDPQAAREARLSWGRMFDNGLAVMVSFSGMNADGEDLFLDYGDAGISGIAAGMDGEKTRRVHLQVDHGDWSIEHSQGTWFKEDPNGTFFSDPLSPGQYIDSKLALTQLQYENRFAGEQLTVSARLYRSMLRFRSVLHFSGVEFAADTQSRLYGGELRLVYGGIDRHKLMLGIEGQESPRSEQVIPVSGDPADNLLVSSPGHRLGAYGQDEWRLTDRLTGTMGLRIDHNDMTGTHASPRTGLIWQATPTTSIRLLYGSAQRAPNAYERYYDDGATLVGNPDLRGERIDTFELVADQRLGRSTQLRASLYQWNMKRLIVLGLHPDSGLPQYQSGEEIRARGTELSMDRTWRSGVRLRGSLSLQDVSWRGGGNLVNSPRVLGKANLSGLLPWGGIRASYELRYDSRRLTHEGTWLGGYTLSNFSLGRTVRHEGLEASLGIYNLFDKHYATPAANSNWQNAFEQDGRAVRFKLGYRF